MIAHKPTLPPPRVGTLGTVGTAAKSATSAGKSVTLLATAPAEVPVPVSTTVVVAVVPARKLGGVDYRCSPILVFTCLDL